MRPRCLGLAVKGGGIGLQLDGMGRGEHCGTVRADSCRDTAHRLVYETSIAARERRQTLIEALRANPAIVAALGECDLDALLDPARHTGQCAAMVDRVLAAGDEP